MKFALFQVGTSLRRIVEGGIERIGLPDATLRVKGLNEGESFSRIVDVPDHAAAAEALMDWLEERIGQGECAAVGHRVVHGGPKHHTPQPLSVALINDLRDISPMAPEHLPAEILLVEAFHGRFPDLPQVACFDTAFHHDLPHVARMLAIPRRYEDLGVRRYGFHGLSYEFLMGELGRQAGPDTAQGRVILAHLGNGASLAAVRGGQPLDTSMGLSPAAGLVMGSRSGDLDPGLVGYLGRTEHMTTAQFNHMVNHESGLRGISGTTSDMRNLISHADTDHRAEEAIAFFCYQAKKWIGAFVAALGGLDTLVFSAGVGENCPSIRARICQGLNVLGIELNETENAKNAPVISEDTSPVVVRVIHTDEEIVIARSTIRVLGL